MNDVFWPLVALVPALLACYAGMLTSVRETRAVRGGRLWPFRRGIVAARFTAPAGAFREAGLKGVAAGFEYRVISPTECVFVEEDWQSAMSWTRSASPFRLKGCAVSRPSGIEVTGRISLGVCITLPASVVWLGGGGLLGMREHPGLSSILVLVGVGLPILLSWFSLPKEIAAFHAGWDAVSKELTS